MSVSPAAPITVDSFKAWFVRDFPFGTAPTSTVLDSDIERAINEGVMLFNPGLWDQDDQRAMAYMYLAAHLLVLNIRAAGGLGSTGKGVNSTGSFPLASKSAGPLSVGYAIPQDMTDEPILSQFAKTEYGQKYLQLMRPQLIGGMGVVGGGTQP